MLTHWIWLTQRPGIGTYGRAVLLRAFGTAERIYAAKESELRAMPGMHTNWLAPLLDKSTAAAEQVLLDCEQHEIRLLTYADEAYPERLRNIPDPPALLYYKGTFPDFDREAAIAVIGSRKCSPYGLMYAKRFARQIANSGGLVVSGGARGIDTMAMYGALDSRMPVVGVMGRGLDEAYPRENHALFEAVTRHGCIISEYPPKSPPFASHFPVRNRIISGLSLGVLVVEAPERSGALITAKQALDQGRDVFAVPGNIGVKYCEGSNRLLREGATLVENGWDVLREYTYMFPDKLSDSRKREAMERIAAARYGRVMPVYSPVLFGENGKKHVDNSAPRTYSDRNTEPQELTADERTILELLTDEPILADTLVARSALPAQRVLAALTMLQIKQLAVKLAGNTYQRKF